MNKITSPTIEESYVSDLIPESFLSDNLVQRSLIKKVGTAAVGRALRVVNTVNALQRSGPFAEINKMYGFSALFAMEGFMRPSQADFLSGILAAKPHAQNIGEIGFNGGHSSFLFLNASEQYQVTSFDIGEHDYVSRAADYIGERFQGRHTLILGDSTKTVPEYEQNQAAKFDLIFIDGGHDYATAKSDIENMRALARPDNTVVVDDYMPHVDYGVGPARAWDEAVRAGTIVQEAIVSGDNRTWAVGRYARLS